MLKQLHARYYPQLLVPLLTVFDTGIIQWLERGKIVEGYLLERERDIYTTAKEYLFLLLEQPFFLFHVRAGSLKLTEMMYSARVNSLCPPAPIVLSQSTHFKALGRLDYIASGGILIALVGTLMKLVLQSRLISVLYV